MAHNFAVLRVTTEYSPPSMAPTPEVKKVYIHPPSADRILLPDGRFIAYKERGVAADRARFSVIAPHAFLSSRLAGFLIWLFELISLIQRFHKILFAYIVHYLSSFNLVIPGLKSSLLEEYGVRLLTYDLPGFGESDPHPERNLESSAMDMSLFAIAVGVNGKFWVLGYSSGSIHAWAALRYIPDRLSGINPSSM